MIIDTIYNESFQNFEFEITNSVAGSFVSRGYMVPIWCGLKFLNKTFIKNFHFFLPLGVFKFWSDETNTFLRLLNKVPTYRIITN